MVFYSKMSYPVLQSLLLGAAQTVAARHRASIEELDLTLHQKSSRALEFQVDLTLCKWVTFIPATVDITVSGHLEIDNDFRLVASRLRASGKGLRGFVGVLAGLFVDAVEKVQELLTPLNGRSIALETLFPGCEVRDCQLSCSAKHLEIKVLFANEYAPE